MYYIEYIEAGRLMMLALAVSLAIFSLFAYALKLVTRRDEWETIQTTCLFFVGGFLIIAGALSFAGHFILLSFDPVPMSTFTISQGSVLLFLGVIALGIAAA